MSSTHAGGGGHAGPPVPEPSYGERARTLIALTRAGMLSTHSRRRPGFPFGSVMPFALDGTGRPVFLISSMAMHTQNLAADPRASLLVADAAGGSDPLGLARVTLVGEVAQVEAAGLRELYLACHPNVRHWVDYEDFAFYRMEVVDAYFVGGFGVMGWVTAEDYLAAAPDPLAEAAPGIIGHMNDDHAGALVEIARHFAGAEAASARMTSVDRLGFHVRLTTAARTWGVRIGFPREVTTTGQSREVFVEMVRQARAGRSS